MTTRSIRKSKSPRGTEKRASEIRLDEDGNLDEVVVGKFPKARKPFTETCVHVERMADGWWWIGIDMPGGGSIHVNFWTRKKGRKIHARAERNV